MTEYLQIEDALQVVDRYGFHIRGSLGPLRSEALKRRTAQTRFCGPYFFISVTRPGYMTWLLWGSRYVPACRLFHPFGRYRLCLAGSILRGSIIPKTPAGNLAPTQ